MKNALFGNQEYFKIFCNITFEENRHLFNCMTSRFKIFFLSLCYALIDGYLATVDWSLPLLHLDICSPSSRRPWRIKLAPLSLSCLSINTLDIPALSNNNSNYSPGFVVVNINPSLTLHYLSRNISGYHCVSALMYQCMKTTVSLPKWWAVYLCRWQHL